MADCLFCAIVAGEIPATTVLETDRILAFRDINPQAPTHVLVIPKDHHRNLGALATADPELLGELARAGHPGGQVRDRPPRRCAWTCGTVWPASAPVLKTTR